MAGLVATATNRRGQMVSWRYDSLGRIVKYRDPTAGVDSVEVFQYSDAPGAVWVSDSNQIAVNRSYVDINGWLDSTITTYPLALIKRESCQV